jgi:rhamnogalacturonyl hydrolase YesR
MRKIIILFLVAIPLLNYSLNAQERFFNEEMANSALKLAARQYQLMKDNLPFNHLPRTIDKDNQLVTTDSEAWTSGFYPGICWYLYEYTANEMFKIEAINSSMLVEKQKFLTKHHDVGFMIYCSSGNGYRLTGEKNFKDIIMQAASSLITRFDPDVGCIQSWNSNDEWKFPVIIDNMMNLELLFKATEFSNDDRYRRIAIHHANQTMKNHFREDNSSYHVISYNPISGEVEKKHTKQGYSHESAWARGQAWGFYGFVMSYRMTERKEYLAQAKKIADFLLSHKNLPEDMIPYWDYDDPEIPNAPRDASAAAIIASALIELSTYVEERVLRDSYLSSAEKILNSLSSEIYSAEVGQNGNFILKHSTGYLPGDAEVDVPLIYADYYYIEALLKYLKLADN